VEPAVPELKKFKGKVLNECRDKKLVKATTGRGVPGNRRTSSKERPSPAGQAEENKKKGRHGRAQKQKGERDQKQKRVEEKRLPSITAGLNAKEERKRHSNGPSQASTRKLELPSGRLGTRKAGGEVSPAQTKKVAGTRVATGKAGQSAEQKKASKKSRARATDVYTQLPKDKLGRIARSRLSSEPGEGQTQLATDEREKDWRDQGRNVDQKRGEERNHWFTNVSVGVFKKGKNAHENRKREKEFTDSEGDSVTAGWRETVSEKPRKVWLGGHARPEKYRLSAKDPEEKLQNL